MWFDSKKTARVTTLLFLLLTGCPPKAPQVVSPPVLPPAPPVIEKTFGEIIPGGGSTLLIRYKSITLLADPVLNVGDPLWDQLPSVDYLLLTDAQPHHWGGAVWEALRQNLKILGTDEAVQVLSKHGFTQSKGMAHVQRMMLKKGDDFLFVSVIQGHSASGKDANGYLLEFDNGRNIFISGEIKEETVMREFVYGLRDDGKQVDLAFVYDESFIELIQPQVAYVRPALGRPTDGRGTEIIHF